MVLVVGSKKCSGCAAEKALLAFDKHPRGKYGYASRCKDCKAAYNKARYAADPERSKENKRKHYYANPEAKKEYSRKWYAENTERALSGAASWVTNNRGKSNAIKKRYKTAKANACPAWLDAWDLFVMEEFYYKATRLKELTGQEYHVDHIHPLQGETVSGLHVPWNLQILTARANIQKSNNLWFW